MSKEARALVINVTAVLMEELLKEHVKNVPEDLKVDSADYFPFDRTLKLYFTSKKFPVVKGKVRRGVVEGRIAVCKNADKTTTATLMWKDPDKEEEG